MSSDHTEKNDRRRFLTQSSAALGGFLVNPAAGLLGLVAASMQPEADRGKAEDEGAGISWRPLLRTGAPVNVAGQPFGGRIGALHAFCAPEALQQNEGPGRYVVVVAHQGAPSGISIIELVRGARGWDHAVASPRNRLLGPRERLTLDGARLDSGGRLVREQKETIGLGCIEAVAGLPWNSVLCGEVDSDVGGNLGWFVEINPITGIATKRLSLGRVQPVSIVVNCVPGRPTIVHSLGGRSLESLYLYRFVSHQRFDAGRLDVNAQTLVMGELSVADFAKGEWVSLSGGDVDWLSILRSPAEAAAERVAPLSDALSLARDEQGLVIVGDSEIRRVLSSSDEASAFSVQVLAGSPEAFSPAALRPRRFTMRFGAGTSAPLTLLVDHDGDAAILSVKAIT